MRITSQKAFICGCGKSYSSEPSLYTHEKNKHNGERQPNTIIPTIKKQIEKVKGRPVSKIFKQQGKFESQIYTNLEQVNSLDQDLSPNAEQSAQIESPYSNQYAIQLMHYYLSSKSRRDILEKSNSIHTSSQNIIPDDQINEIISQNQKQQNCNSLFMQPIKRLIDDFQQITLFINIEQRIEWIQKCIQIFFQLLSSSFTNEIEQQNSSELVKILDNFKKTINSS